jgi:hypothetical protein
MGVAGAYEKREPSNTSLAMAVNSHPCLDSSEPGIRVLIRELVRYLESGMWFRTSMVRGSGSGTQWLGNPELGIWFRNSINGLGPRVRDMVG